MALSPKDPAEIITITFDFSKLLNTPSSPTVTCTLVGGAIDATPAAMLSGSPSISGATVLQKFIGGVNGATYDVRCQVSAPDGSLYALADLLAVKTV